MNIDPSNFEMTPEHQALLHWHTNKISDWIVSCKLKDDQTNPLTPDAMMAFNLACDFLSHQLKQVAQKIETKEQV